MNEATNYDENYKVVRRKTRWMRFKQGLKELLPAIGIGAVGGMIIGGYAGAIENGKQINKLSKKVDNQGQLLGVVVEKHNQLCDRTWKDHEELDKLQKQQATLMEAALQKTMGR